jgi:SnoaL-like domain
MEGRSPLRSDTDLRCQAEAAAQRTTATAVVRVAWKALRRVARYWRAMDHEEKLRLIRESYDAFNRRDLEALLRLYDPGCEWDLSNYPEWPEEKRYRGRDGLAEFFEAWFDPWEDFYLEIEQIVDLPASRAFGSRLRSRSWTGQRGRG